MSLLRAMRFYRYGFHLSCRGCHRRPRGSAVERAYLRAHARTVGGLWWLPERPEGGRPIVTLMSSGVSWEVRT